MIFKLRNNKPLTAGDVNQLESILWNELDTKEDYEKEFSDTPITKLVRQIVGLDKHAANEFFIRREFKHNINSIRSSYY